MKQQTVFPPLSDRDKERAKKTLEYMMGFMVVKFHFVYHILGMTTKVMATPEQCPTMGVRVTGNGFELVYNPVFLLTTLQKDEHLTWVLYHEILHLALQHCTTREFEDHDLGNIAHDLAANELIPNMPGSCTPPLNPDGTLFACHVSEMQKQPMYKDIQFKQTAEWYYEYLRQKCKENKGKGKGGKEGKGSLPTNGSDDHSGWKEDQIAAQKVRIKIAEIAQNEMWGSVSASDQEIIRAAQVQRINWPGLIFTFYGNIAWKDRESTRKRPNRRTGIIHPGSKKIMVDRHLVDVDTSGSMSKELLSKCLGIVNQISEEVPIDLMQCDCETQTEPKPFDSRVKDFKFLGRGGTSFDPVIEMAEKRHYRSVMIITDGDAPEPRKPKGSIKVVWVLPAGKKRPAPWGTVVYMSLH